ncbi:hypothetical protein JYB87_07390 [Shewanella avicenniae]|uniref:Uncharacterized protein n=1 Tax=Shewanella avicenniae TaxID=2814294 RepID=A0ABX7QUB7_9GAMM|nr:hypothetical protein [Shewanella avicenniae]QSX35034.1 hypothetical protein JYB87_07390 [Shewanella avicenniae]
MRTLNFVGAIVGLLLSVSVAAHASTVDETTGFLLKSAAADFVKQRAKPTGFRNIRLGYLRDNEGEPVYLLCGEFSSVETPGNPDWTQFATLKTERYEQWIGGSAEALCAKGQFSPTQPADLVKRLHKEIGETAERQK